MNYLIDENLPGKVIELFRTAGHDVADLHQEGLAGATDAAIANACQNAQRCFVTVDSEFAHIGVHLHKHLPGVIVIRLQSMGRRGILRIVPRLLTALGCHDVRGQLWIVERNGIRVRG